MSSIVRGVIHFCFAVISLFPIVALAAIVMVVLMVLDREPRTVIHVKRAKMFDPMG